MLAIFGLIITAVWKFLCIPIKVDEFTFTVWQFNLFIIVIAVLLNIIFKRKEE